jgi:hypothetical protein
MTRIEKEIRGILKSENSAILLSEKLFSRFGLFSRMASSEQERKKVARSPLFRQALARFAELKRKEAATRKRAREKVLSRGV